MGPANEPLPGLWLLSSLYFRGEVRGLGNIPEDGPVLLVGNHSGGNVTPDTDVSSIDKIVQIIGTVPPGG